MQVISLQPIPSQTVRTSLGEQDVQVSVYQKDTGLYVDVQLNESVIIRGEICRNGVLLVRQEYLGMIGDLAFLDMSGTEDPYYTGLGSRFELLYLTPEDVYNQGQGLVSDEPYVSQA